MTSTRELADVADDLVLEIDGFYEEAINNPCTCNVDENSCSHCNAWSLARRRVRTAVLEALRTLPSSKGSTDA